MTTDNIDASFREAYRAKELLGTSMECVQERLAFVRDAFREFPPPAAAGHYLFILNLGIGRWLEIDDDLCIGTADDCELELQRPGVSRRHCRLARTDTGWDIHDLDSTNGTFVNERQVQQTRLVNGDVLLMGDATLIYFERVALDS